MLRSQPDVKFDTGNEEESRGLPGLPAACRPARRVLAPLLSFQQAKPRGAGDGGGGNPGDSKATER